MFTGPLGFNVLCQSIPQPYSNSANISRAQRNAISFQVLCADASLSMCRISRGTCHVF
jgi:hypothetical protein